MFEKHPILARLTLGLLFTILFVHALVAVKEFLYPILLAVLFSFLLYPVAKALEKNGFPRILANLVSILLGVLLLTGVFLFLYAELKTFAADFPRMRVQAAKNLTMLYQLIEDKLGVPAEDQAQWLQGVVADIFISSEGSVVSALTGTAGTLLRFFLIPIYIYFLLYYRDKFKNFILRLTPIRHHQKAELILTEVSHVTGKYMTGIFLVVLILCFLNSIGLIIVGIRFPILFGIISAILNFFPYVGTWMGGIIPLMVALLTEESPHYALGVFILFSIIQPTENYILTPNIVGGQVRINPFFVILALIIGAMLWGLPGMFLILPFLGMFKVVADHVGPLQPYAYLLDSQGTERHALTLDKIKRILGWKGTPKA